MKLLLLTLDITEKGRPIQVSYEPWDDVFVYINTKDTLPISPEWIIKTKFKAQFFIDASKEGYGSFHAVTAISSRDMDD